MLVGFRQGLVRAPANFVQVVNGSVALQVPPGDTIIASIADGQSEYLISEKTTIEAAWGGPFAANTDYWLYWDLNLVTGVRTFGYTLHEPLESPVAPTSPADDQHWFDTTVNQMKVFTQANGRWHRVIRVFAAKLTQGSVFMSMSYNAPDFTGTQVGIVGQYSSGALIFDNLGGILKKKNGTFFTTEDYALTGIANSSQVKYASIQVRALAKAYMPALTVVHFTDFDQVYPANPHIIDKVAYGIIEFEANKDEYVNITLDGVVRNAAWDWSSVGVQSPVYVDEYGAVTATPSVPPIPIGVVIDTNAVLIRPASVTSNVGPTGYTGSQGNIGYTGSQGIAGLNGSIGYTGSQGFIGYTGSQGVQGMQGQQGDFGYTGSQGQQGQQGDIGYTGSAGNDGATGYTGSRGDIGYTGSAGATGTVGYTGSAGNDGATGYTGSRGDIGYTGSAGATGTVGYTGSAGNDGTNGSTGYTGSAGVDGAIGYTGSQGAVGYTGSQGPQGLPGTGGSTGIYYAPPM